MHAGLLARPRNSVVSVLDCTVRLRAAGRPPRRVGDGPCLGRNGPNGGARSGFQRVPVGRGAVSPLPAVPGSLGLCRVRPGRFCPVSVWGRPLLSTAPPGPVLPPARDRVRPGRPRKRPMGRLRQPRARCGVAGGALAPGGSGSTGRRMTAPGGPGRAYGALCRAGASLSRDQPRREAWATQAWVRRPASRSAASRRMRRASRSARLRQSASIGMRPRSASPSRASITA